MGKNLLRLDTSGFEEYIAKLEKLEAEGRRYWSRGPGDRRREGGSQDGEDAA